MDKPTSNVVTPSSNKKKITGGISYVKASEDESLPCVVYRADDNLQARTSNEARLKELVTSQLKYLHCCVLQIAKKALKDYVLDSDERSGQLITAEKFKQLDFTRNNVATVLHYCFSDSELVLPTKKPSKANVLLALWTYTSPPSQSERVRERLCVEFFVEEQLWKTLKPEIRCEFKYFQVLVERFVREKVPTRRLSSIRDGPRIELVMQSEQRDNYTVQRWYFPKESLPDDADEQTSVGVTTYVGIFTFQELDQIERIIDTELLRAPKGSFLPDTFQCNYRGKKLIRTKIFFESRYLWGDSKSSKNDPAAGVRADVDPAPDWLHKLVEERLISLGLVKAGWLNSFAINVYHDGSLGLASHMDDTSRFEQPIFSLRLYSSSRLTFGAQKQGMTNPLFFIPMPRGCVTVMEEGSYAANKVTHCIRPSDMSGKSAAIIMRRVRPRALRAARALQVLEKEEEKEE